jgi:hypothetical protein
MKSILVPINTAIQLAYLFVVCLTALPVTGSIRVQRKLKCGINV